jgi:hypothetical protein
MYICIFRKIMRLFQNAAARTHCDYAGIYHRHAGHNIGMNLIVETGNNKVFCGSW